MIRSEREEILRRYLDGEMNLSEEHDFLIQVALDDELRLELKAQQTIDSAIRKDREIDPSEYSSLHSHVTSLLAASQTAVDPLTSSPSGAAAAGLDQVQRWWSTGTLGVVVTLMGLFAIAPLFPLPDVHTLPPKSVRAPAAGSVSHPSMPTPPLVQSQSEERTETKGGDDGNHPSRQGTTSRQKGSASRPRHVGPPAAATANNQSSDQDNMNALPSEEPAKSSTLRRAFRSRPAEGDSIRIGIKLKKK